MSVEGNRSLVRRYFTESVNEASGPNQEAALAILDDLLTDDFAMAYNNDTEPVRGRERHKEFLVEHARAYPSDTWVIEDLATDGDTVACQWHIHATHARSNRRIDVRAADFFKVRDGRLAELRRFLDFDDLRRQTKPRRRSA